MEEIVKKAFSDHLAPLPAPLTKEDVKEIVNDALSHHFATSISQKIKDAVERNSLEEAVTRLQLELREEKEKVREKAAEERRKGELAVSEERRRGEVAVAEERKKEKTRYNWEAYSSGVGGARRLQAESSRSVSG